MARLAVFFLIIIMALPALAQSGAPAGDDAGAEDASTEEAVASPEVSPPVQPTAVPSPTSTPSPVLVLTTIPTATLPPTQTLPIPSPTIHEPTSTASIAPTVETIDPTPTLPPTETIPVPSPATGDATSAQPVVPTVATIALTATLPPTESPTVTSTSDVVPSLTTEPSALTPPPTALPYPTLALPTSTAVPQSLPALATFDNGAHDWIASPGWSLQPHENGQAWVITGSSIGTLYWQSPISLLGAAAPVTLTFQSQASAGGVAVVQMSTDGDNWQSISTVPASESWATVSIDLSGYVGGVLYVGFAWQNTDAGTPSQWALDTVLVAEISPTEIAPIQPSAEIVIEPSPTSALTALVIATSIETADTSTPQVIDTTEPTATDFATTDSGDMQVPTEDEQAISPTMTATLTEIPPTVPTEEASATSTETLQAAVTEQPLPVSVACELDVDADGIFTDRDLAQIGREALSATTQDTALYDLDGNQQIDIGDLQMMTNYLFESCSG